jgi:hypothetical protein
MTAVLAKNATQLKLTPLRAGHNTLLPLARSMSRAIVQFEMAEEGSTAFVAHLDAGPDSRSEENIGTDPIAVGKLI